LEFPKQWRNIAFDFAGVDPMRPISSPAASDNNTIMVALLDATLLVVTTSGVFTDANQCIAAFNYFGVTAWRAFNVIVMNSTTSPILVWANAFINSYGIAFHSAIITNASYFTHNYSPEYQESNLAPKFNSI